jgi:hypothetical protein
MAKECEGCFAVQHGMATTDISGRAISEVCVSDAGGSAFCIMAICLIPSGNAVT